MTCSSQLPSNMSLSQGKRKRDVSIRLFLCETVVNNNDAYHCWVKVLPAWSQPPLEVAHCARDVVVIAQCWEAQRNLTGNI